MQCKFDLRSIDKRRTAFVVAFSFAKVREENAWVDEVKDDLCRVLHDRQQLVTIFKFDSKQHNGNLEDAILEALLNGNCCVLFTALLLTRFACLTAAKFSGDHNEQHRRTAELKLALVFGRIHRSQSYSINSFPTGLA